MAPRETRLSDTPHSTLGIAQERAASQAFASVPPFPPLPATSQGPSCLLLIFRRANSSHVDLHFKYIFLAKKCL